MQFDVVSPEISWRGSGEYSYKGFESVSRSIVSSQREGVTGCKSPQVLQCSEFPAGAALPNEKSKQGRVVHVTYRRSVRLMTETGVVPRDFSPVPCSVSCRGRVFVYGRNLLPAYLAAGMQH